MMRSSNLAAALWAAALLGVAGAAHAQSMNANSAAYNAGWGRSADQENQPANYGVRDANGNLLITDGVIDTGATASASAGGAADVFAGVGASGGSATAIGNSLNVVTQGNYNTVIVNSTQTNNGAVSATTH